MPTLRRARPAEARQTAIGRRRTKLAPTASGDRTQKKLSFNERREFDRLPGRIEALEQELRGLNEAVAGPEFYKNSADAIAATLARLESVQQELHVVYARWDELDSRT